MLHSRQVLRLRFARLFLVYSEWNGVFMHIFRLTYVSQSQCGRKAMVSLQSRNKSIAVRSRQKSATFSCRSTKAPRKFLWIIFMLLAMSFYRWTKIATEWKFRWQKFCHVLPVLCDVSFCEVFRQTGLCSKCRSPYFVPHERGVSRFITTVSTKSNLRK